MASIDHAIWFHRPRASTTGCCTASTARAVRAHAVSRAAASIRATEPSWPAPRKRGSYVSCSRSPDRRAGARGSRAEADAAGGADPDDRDALAAALDRHLRHDRRAGGRAIAPRLAARATDHSACRSTCGASRCPGSGRMSSMSRSFPSTSPSRRGAACCCRIEPSRPPMARCAYGSSRARPTTGNPGALTAADVESVRGLRYFPEARRHAVSRRHARAQMPGIRRPGTSRPRWLDYRVVIGDGLFWYRRRRLDIARRRSHRGDRGIPARGSRRGAALLLRHFLVRPKDKSRRASSSTPVDLHDRGGRAHFRTPDGRALHARAAWPRLAAVRRTRIAGADPDATARPTASPSPRAGPRSARRASASTSAGWRSTARRWYQRPARADDVAPAQLASQWNRMYEHPDAECRERGEHDDDGDGHEQQAATAAARGLVRRGDECVEQREVARLRLEREIEQVAEDRHHADERIERDVAEHVQLDAAGARSDCAPRCSAYTATIPPAMSPRPGTRPNNASRPKRHFVPGTANAWSNSCVIVRRRSSPRRPRCFAFAVCRRRARASMRD